MEGGNHGEVVMIRSLIWETGFGGKENVKDKYEYLCTNKEIGIQEVGILYRVQM